jgi:hypothetical protein
LIYAAKNFPEFGWLEILPKADGKEVRETYIVYESVERAFQRIRVGEISTRFPVGYQGPKEAPGAKIGCLILALKPAIAGWSQQNVRRDSTRSRSTS